LVKAVSINRKFVDYVSSLHPEGSANLMEVILRYVGT
jgi:hypothetical protein